MTDIIDLTGRQFGDLIVLRRMRKRKPGPFSQELWLCQCPCETTPIVQRRPLLDGTVMACGTCSHPEAVREATRRTASDASTTMVCRVCTGEPQPLEAFPRRGTIRYGRRPACKRCEAAARATYHARKKAEAG